MPLRILWIDDHPVNWTHFRTSLEIHGTEVDLVPTCYEAEVKMKRTSYYDGSIMRADLRQEGSPWCNVDELQTRSRIIPFFKRIYSSWGQERPLFLATDTSNISGEYYNIQRELETLAKDKTNVALVSLADYTPSVFGYDISEKILHATLKLYEDSRIRSRVDG